MENPRTLPPVNTLLAGIIAGAAFAIFSRTIAGGPLFLYLPSIPLIYAGLTRGAAQTSFASLVAFIIITLLSDMDYGVFFLLILALPTCFFLRELLLWREERQAEGKAWYPLLMALTKLTAVAATLFMTLSMTAQHSVKGGLQALIVQELAGKIITDDTNLLMMLKFLTHEGKFSVICIYGLVLGAYIVFLYPHHPARARA